MPRLMAEFVETGWERRYGEKGEDPFKIECRRGLALIVFPLGGGLLLKIDIWWGEGNDFIFRLHTT